MAESSDLTSTRDLLVPDALTPQPTGSSATSAGSSDGASPSATGADPSGQLRPRKSTAFYPNLPRGPGKAQKPFSRSAAKRASVMALGSIEHLQHYFTKTGLAAPTNPLKPHMGAVSALGPGLHLNSSPGNQYTDLPTFKLPPTPVIPQNMHHQIPTIPRPYNVDPEILKPGVIDDLDAVARAWLLPPSPPPPPVEDGKDGNVNVMFDVLAALQTTTRAIRHVRNYIVALPDSDSHAHHSAPKEQYRSKVAAMNTGRRALPAVPALGGPPPPEDKSGLVRKAALEVLATLRELEERARLPLSDDAYDAHSDRGLSPEPNPGPSPPGSGLSGFRTTLSPERLARTASTSSDVGSQGQSENGGDTSFAFTLVKVAGRDEHVPVWEEEEEFNAPPTPAVEKEAWDERLVLQSGWLYKPDLKLEDLELERGKIARYLDVADQVLFGGPPPPSATRGEDGRENPRGWEAEREKLARREKADRDARGVRRRASAGILQGGVASESQEPEVEPGPGRKGRRVVSAQVLGTLSGLSISGEPEPMSTEEAQAQEQRAIAAFGLGLGLGSLAEEEDDEIVDDDALPEWARRNAFSHDPLGRIHAVIASYTPPYLTPSLPASTPTDRTALLNALSSGQILCEVYNACVRRSKKPWGFVAKATIHDLQALEANGDVQDAKKEKGWTFRRVDNLRIWAAALKLRYSLPITTPSTTAKAAGIGSGSTPVSSPSSKQRTFRMPEVPIYFDALLVARRDPGWEEMLETIVGRWVDAVVGEKRGEL